VVTTKYTKKHSRDRSLDFRKDKVVIAESDDEVKEYICDSCNFIIHTRLTDGEITCYHCGNVIEIQKTRRKSKLETPHRNTETLIADPRTTYSGSNLSDSVKIKHEPELQGGFKALRDKGLKITNYKEDIPT
jgi:predicted RNA-binding Zn-ribbon protein involved in translation (DUF1610 family)